MESDMNLLQPIKKIVLTATTTLFVAGAAFAGPQYIDNTSFAVSGYDVVAYFDLKQAAVGETQPLGIPGNSKYTAEYNGSTFAFATPENREKFLADPAKYAPQFDGHCAYGVAQGGKVPGNPNLWRIVDGKLYLNITKNVVGFWEEDISGNISKGDNNWSGLEAKDASTRAIPDFTSAAPVQN